MPENHPLKLAGRHLIHLLDRFSGELLDRRKSLAFRSIGHGQENEKSTCSSCHRSHHKAPLPAYRSYDQTCENEGYEFAEIWTRAEDTVECTSLRLREPAREADDSRSRAHGLHPAVYAPEDCEDKEYRADGKGYASVDEAEYAHKKVYGCRDREACEHESADIAVVCYEAVQELSYGIDKKEGRAYDSELACCEHTFVNEGLLDHAEAHSTHIVQTICDSNSPESLVSEGSVRRAHFVLGDRVLSWLAYSVK